MGFFDIFKKKQDSAAADIPESRQQQQEELNAGLEKTKTGIFSKLARAVAGRSTVDADLLDDVEEVLITSDVGVETTVKIIRRIEERVARDKYMNTSELQSILREEVMSLMEESHGSEKHFGLDARQGEPYVVMVVGVNGAGKTTTIGKLAAQLTKAGLKVWIGAADTFRAAAIDQLKVWADRAGATMIRQEMEEIQELKDQVLEENRILEENRMKVGELNGKIVLLSMQNKTLSGLLKELGGELTVGPSSEQYISAFRLLLAIKEGTLRGKLSDGERYKLFSLFDLLYANYVTRLLDKAPLLTKRDLEICCFLKFGLTNEELARIFQTSSDSVTKAKGRLKGRLGISSQEDLNAFLRDF